MSKYYNNTLPQLQGEAKLHFSLFKDCELFNLDSSVNVSQQFEEGRCCKIKRSIKIAQLI